MLFFALGLKDVVDIINNAIRGLFANLCQLIYPLIASFYQIFRELGMLFYNDTFSTIYDRISMIIGVFMVFRVIFWLIELLVSPDKITDKEKNPGKIVQKVLISVILLATTPRIFKIAFNLQYDIVSKNVIESLLNTTYEKEDDGKFGQKLSAELFINFYTINYNGDEVDENCKRFTGKGENDDDGIIYLRLKEANDLSALTNGCLTDRYDSDSKDESGVYKINFNGLFAVGVGAVVFWMILMYCISLGTRYVQLIFLQVIAPVPIMCYLTPQKDNMLSKWVKQCTTTYLDLFIRIAIINFVMVLIGELFNNTNAFIAATGELQGWIKLFLVLGLLTFAKKAPDLIQELLPKSVTKASGDFGLSWKKRTDAMLGGNLVYNTTKRAPGFVAGGTVGSLVGGYMGARGGKGVGSRLAGFVSGAARGFSTGSKKGSIFKNIGEVRKNQAAQNSKLEQWRIAANKGENEPNTFGDYLSRKTDANKRAMGFETNSQNLERRTKAANEAADSQKNVLEYGKGKSKEKNTRLKAFGKDIGIAEMEAKSKQATTAYQNNSIEKLLSTAEGETTLKMAARKKYEENLKNTRMASGETEAQALAWMAQNSSSVDSGFNTYFNGMNGKDKETLAGEVMDNLQKDAYAAQKEFTDYEKQAAFSFLIDDRNAQNVKNDFAKITEFLKNDKEFANDVCADYVKRKNGLIPGTQQYDSYIVDSSEINDELIEEMFNLEELNKLKTKAEGNDQQAIREFDGVFKAFDMFKTLKARYAAENSTPEALRDKANDKFNSSK